MASPRCSLEEKIGIIKLYYKTSNVARRWCEVFTSPAPHRNTMMDVVRRFEATGSVADLPRSGRPRSATSEEHKEALKTAVVRSPNKSTSRSSLLLAVSRTSVWRMLRELGFRPYRPRLIHGLSEADFGKRLTFCTKFLDLVEKGEFSGHQDRLTLRHQTFSFGAF